MLATEFSTLKLALARQPKKILIVEDDVLLETVLSRILVSIDPSIEYKWMVTAEEAQKEIAREEYSLILSDILLLGKDSGLDLWDYCQAEYPEIPFVLMSGVGVDKFLKLVGRNNISPPFLPKPFFVGECRQVLEGLLQADIPTNRVKRFSPRDPTEYL